MNKEISERAIKSIFESRDLEEWVDRYSMAPLLHSWGKKLSQDNMQLSSEKIRSNSFRQSIVEEAKKSSIIEISNSLHVSGIPFLFFKGTALAYTIYKEPYLRPRADTDLFIHLRDIATVRKIFQTLGYHQESGSAGELVSYQEIHQKNHKWNIPLTFDVHWKLSNPQIFSDLFTLEELLERSQIMPKLSLSARAPSRIDSLLIACIHRVAHHYDEEDPLSAFDIHLLANSLDSDEWSFFAKLAKDKKITKICERGLKLAKDFYGTAIPENIEAELSQAKDEDSGRFLRKDRRWIHDLVTDFRALPSWKKRILLLKEHIFPPQEFMRKKYALRSNRLLPLMYAWRLLAGVGKLFKKFRE